MDGLVALLSLGAGVAAWWWVAKWLGAKGKGIVVRHVLGFVAWFLVTPLLFGAAQAAGIVSPTRSEPRDIAAAASAEAGGSAKAPAFEASETLKSKAKTKVGSATSKARLPPQGTRGLTAEYLAGEFCPSNSPCYTFTDADRIEAVRLGKPVHVVGTLAKAPSRPLFGGGPVAELEGRRFCPVTLAFDEGADSVLDAKPGQRISAKCTYEKGDEKGVSLKLCTLASAPTSVEPPGFSWEHVAIPEPPAALKGMSTEEVDRLYRAVLVAIWNGQVTRSREHARVYTMLAEKLGVHVDKLKAAHEYVRDKQEALVYGFRQLLDRDPEIAPEYYAPVSATAYGGSYTFDVELHLGHCPSEGTQRAKGEAETLLQKVRKLLPPQATTLRAPRVHYKCEQLGTDGVLEFGYLWRLDEKEPKLMSECSGTYGMTRPENTRHWCQSSWTNGKLLEE